VKISDQQPRMSKIEFFLYLGLLVISLLLAAWLVANGRLSQSVMTEIVVGAMLTLLIVSMVELIPEFFRRASEHSMAAKFRRFFGDATCQDSVRLVFAHRRLDPSVPGNKWITHHQVPGRPVPEGVNAWLSAQDVRAAVYVSSTLFKFTDRDVKFIHDKDLEQDDFDFCAISLGLGFNGFTRRLAGWCDDQLFKIKWGESVKGGLAETDFFSIGGSRVPSPPEGKDDCIVARVVPPTEQGKAQRVCFVCAGRTAAGTAAAGLYLAKKWPKLLDLYERNRKDLSTDSLVVVVRHTAEASGTQEYDSSGVVAVEDNEQLIAWARVAGVE
jgi:hypothetical protein